MMVRRLLLAVACAAARQRTGPLSSSSRRGRGLGGRRAAAGAAGVVAVAPRVRGGWRRDAVAAAKEFAILGVLDKGVQRLATSGVVSRVGARKVMHSSAGVVYLLTWTLFSSEPSARYWAMLGPLALTVKALAVGLGLVDDPATVASMSRSGDRRELLFGPALYGAVFVAATVTSWRSLDGVLALFALCFGDAAAEVVGSSRLSRTWSPRIPWCRRKSLFGSLGFAVATMASATAAVLALSPLGWWPAPASAAAVLSHCARVAAVAALAESLPTRDFDNPLIFAAAALSSRHLRTAQ